jgi:O-antigen ligase
VAASHTAPDRLTLELTRDAPAERESTSALVGIGLLVALAMAAIAYLSFSAGGYFPPATGFTAIALLLALVLRTTLARRPYEGFSRALAVPLVALALYALWQLLSTRWSGNAARGLDAYDRTLLYLGAFVLFGAVRLRRRGLSWLVRGVVAAMAATCVAGLLSRTLPHFWPTASSFFASRLNYPLTYWNGEGLVAAVTLILALHLASERREHWVTRILSAAVLPAVAATLLLTFSRGALAVTVIGLVVYAVLGHPRTLPTTLLAVVPPVAVALKVTWDATALATANATGPAGVSQGHHVAIVLAACTVAAGWLRGVMLAADYWLSRRARAGRTQNPWVGWSAAAIGVVAAVVVAIAAGAPGFIKREYHGFVNASGPSESQTRSRLTDPNNDGRLPLWQVGLDEYRLNEFHGTGAGTYQEYYPQFRTTSSYVSDAHNLYVQSLAELGIVGVALIAIVVLGILGGLATRIRGPDRALYAALFSAALAWAIHQGFDWDWQLPATTLWLFITAGAALAWRNDGPRRGLGIVGGRTLIALGWLIAGVTPFLVGTSYARLQTSVSALQQGDCVRAKSTALSSLSLSAKRPDAYEVIGLCDLEQGFPAAATQAMDRAAALEPGSWETAYWVAVAQAAAGQNSRAAALRARSIRWSR